MHLYCTCYAPICRAVGMEKLHCANHSNCYTMLYMVYNRVSVTDFDIFSLAHRLLISFVPVLQNYSCQCQPFKYIICLSYTCYTYLHVYHIQTYIVSYDTDSVQIKMITCSSNNIRLIAFQLVAHAAKALLARGITMEQPSVQLVL